MEIILDKMDIEDFKEVKKYLYLINIFKGTIKIIEKFDMYTEEELNVYDFTSYYACETNDFERDYFKILEQIENIILRDIAVGKNLLKEQDGKYYVENAEEFIKLKENSKGFILEDFNVELIKHNI